MPDWICTFQNRARHDRSKRGQHDLAGFSLGRLHMGEGQVQGDKALVV